MAPGWIFGFFLTFATAGMGLVTGATAGFEFSLARACFVAADLALLIAFFSWRSAYREKAIHSDPLIWVAGAATLLALILVGGGGVVWVHIKEGSLAASSALQVQQAGSAPLQLDITYRTKSWSESRANNFTYPAEDSTAFFLGPVVITNLSKTEKVILDIIFHLSSKDGWNTRAVCSDISPGGYKIGERNGLNEKLERYGVHSDPYFRCPVSLGPLESVTGRLVFIENWDATTSDRYILKEINQHDFMKTLIFTDRISGKSIEIPVAENYRQN